MIATNKVGNRPLLWMPIGDSITVGGGSALGAWRLPLHNLLVARGVAPRAMGTFRENYYVADWHEGHTNYEVGDIGDGWAAWAATYAQAPDVICALIGTNNVCHADPAAANFEGDCNDWLDAIYASWPGVSFVLASTPSVFGGDGGAQNRIEQTATVRAAQAAIVAERAAAGRKIALADCSGAATSYADTLDGVHLAAAARGRVAVAFNSALQTLGY